MQGFIRPKDEDGMETNCNEVKNLSLLNSVRGKSNEDTAYGEFSMKYFRPVACHVGLLTNPQGSVKFFQGDTCVVSAVFGPTEVRISKELPHRGAVDVLYRPKITGMSQLAAPVMDPILAERTIENIIISIFESSIHLERISGLGYNMVLQEFEDDGNLLSTCINATTIALLDGGCAFRHTVAAVTIILTSDKRLIIDPCSDQLKQGFDARFTYAISSGLDLLYTNVQGRASASVINVVQAKAFEAVSEMFKFYHFLALKKNRTTHCYETSVQPEVKVEVKRELSPEEDGELTESD